MTYPPAAAVAVRPSIPINIGRFWDGARAEEIIDALLPDLEPYYDFEISASPKVVLYGPYPGLMPQGNYKKVFIGCENLRPLMRECDWAFGVLNERLVNHPKYMRIRRWGNSWDLVQPQKNFSDILRLKTRFCAFVYGNSVYYREAFCRALSRYKQVDAPGRSLNNMASFDSVPDVHNWSEKVEFLRQYKFVIAFENSSRAGYHTEKLSHAIEADCLPIYWGDPEVGETYNIKRILNAHEYLPRPVHFMPRLRDRPHSLRRGANRTLPVKLRQRLNHLADGIEQRGWAWFGFDRLIERIVEIDCDDEQYLQYLREPFLIGNQPPDRSAWVARWREIFEYALHDT
jgi:hypothetical protein